MCTYTRTYEKRYLLSSGGHNDDDDDTLLGSNGVSSLAQRGYLGNRLSSFQEGKALTAVVDTAVVDAVEVDRLTVTICTVCGHPGLSSNTGLSFNVRYCMRLMHM